MHKVADKYDCNKYIKYQHTIKSAIWNEEKAKWEIEVENADRIVFKDEVDVFVNASGVLKLVFALLSPYEWRLGTC
jgi:cation diffusion facilitator CzcD-associated flavoprotein CzcO